MYSTRNYSSIADVADSALGLLLLFVGFRVALFYCFRVRSYSRRCWRNRCKSWNDGSINASLKLLLVITSQSFIHYINSKDSFTERSIPCSPIPQASYELIDELRPADYENFPWRRMSIFPPPPPPTIDCDADASKMASEEDKVDCRALLVVKVLPKSWVQTKKDVLHKWKVRNLDVIYFFQLGKYHDRWFKKKNKLDSTLEIYFWDWVYQEKDWFIMFDKGAN